MVKSEAVQKSDWQKVYKAWSDFKYQEAAERGYNADAAHRASTAFYVEKGKYEKRYSALWEPDEKPEQTPADKLTDKPQGVWKEHHAGSKRVIDGKFITTADDVPQSVIDSALSMRGHNNPPATVEDEIKYRHVQLLDKVAKLIAARDRILPKCATEEYATKLTNFVKQANDAGKLLEKARKEEKAPFLESAKTVDDFFSLPAKQLVAIKTKASGLLTEYLQEKARAEQQARLEAAEQLRAEADAQRAAADALLEVGRKTMAGEAEKAADKIDRHADHMIATSALKTAEVAAVRTATSSASLRTVIVGEIISRADLDLETLRAYIPQEALQKALNMFIATGGRELKGAKIYETSNSVVR